MKGLALAIVAFICIQTIDATGSNKCANDLSNLRKEAAEFFTEFQKEHDYAHQDLEFIQFASLLLGVLLDAAVSVDFGENLELNVLQCFLKQYLDIFKVQLTENGKRISHLECECDMLLYMGNTFKLEHNLFCRRGKLTGCEAELNQLRCELAEFFRVLKKAGRQALVDLSGIKNASQTIGVAEKKLSAKYQFTCDQGETEAQPKNLNNLRRDLRRSHAEFKRPYDAARIQLDEFSGICNNLTIAIDAWNTKLA